ncbi:DUF4124 domain-containing protein, partial [Verminephrobacter aporrectodeae subsp. tuberculatae]|nr:DUF4124 domain-containing protein [Verminephrobacter aporrectodeae subsp. tuberculatae]
RPRGNSRTAMCSAATTNRASATRAEGAQSRSPCCTPG